MRTRTRLAVIGPACLAGIAQETRNGPPGATGIPGSDRSMAAMASPSAATPGDEESDGPDSYLYQLLFLHGNSGSVTYSPLPQIMNRSDEPVDVMFELFQEDGSRLSLPFKDSNGAFAGNFSHASGPLGPRDRGYPMLADASGLARSGWVRMSASSPDDVTAQTWLALGDRLSGTGVLAFPAARAADAARAMSVENLDGSRMILALLNPGEEPIVVQLSAFRGQVRPDCTARVTLRPLQLVRRSVLDLISCAGRNRGAFQLEIDPAGEMLVSQAYYDYGRGIVATAPIEDRPSLDDAEEDVESQTLPLASAQTWNAPLTGVQCTPRIYNGPGSQRTAVFRLRADQTQVLARLHFAGAPAGRETECEWVATVTYAGKSPTFINNFGPQQGRGRDTIRFDVRRNHDRRNARTAVVRIYLRNDPQNATTLRRARVTFRIFQWRAGA